MEEKTYFYLYKITNKINSRFYIGIHQTKNLADNYMGSGVLLEKAIEKYGIENFEKEILEFFESRDELLSKEKEIVNEEFCSRKETYNIRVGGHGGWEKGKTVGKDKHGNRFYIDVDDKRLSTGELVNNSVGKVVVKDENGNTCSISIDKFNQNKEIYTSIHKNFITVRDKNGNTSAVTVDDERILSGELVHHTKGYMTVLTKDGNKIRIKKEEYNPDIHIFHTKGKITVKDEKGNIFSVSITDPRYLSGEFVHHSKGNKVKEETKQKKRNKVSVRDSAGNTYQVSKNDPRYLSGELVSIMKGRVVVKDKDGNKLCVDKNDPRYLSGELVGITKGCKKK